METGASPFFPMKTITAGSRSITGYEYVLDAILLLVLRRSKSR